jgi:hypothetical protein
MEAKSAKDDVASGMARFQRFGSKADWPTIETGFADRIQELLRRFEMPMKRDGAELDRALAGVPVQQWATDRMADGHDIYIDPALYDPTYGKPLTS